MSSMLSPLMTSPPRAPSADTTIDVDSLSGHEARCLRDHEEDNISDVLRGSDTPERCVGNRCLDALRKLLHVGLRQRRLDDARADSIDVDAERAPLDSKGADQP